MEAFWRRPEAATAFDTWLRLALEALLVLDEPASSGAAAAAGAQIGLDIIPGAPSIP